MPLRATCSVFCLLLAPGFSSATSSPSAASGDSSTAAKLSKNVAIHWLGGWSFGQTDGNRYVEGDEDGNAKAANLAVNLIVSANDRLRFSAQIEAHGSEGGVDEEEAELDFLYGTWLANDAVEVRFGRVKHVFGLYSEVFDLGTARPFLFLPQSIYGPSGIAGESFDGIGLTGYGQARGGDLTWDVYAGELHLEGSEPWDLLELDDDGFEGDDFEDGEEGELFLEEKNRSEVVGFRLVWTAQHTPLSLGFSGYTGVADDQELGEATGTERRDTAFGVQADYSTEDFTLRAEIARLTERGESTSFGGYLEASYRIAPALQLTGRLENLSTDVEEFEVTGPAEELTEHHSWAVGIAWWPHHEWVVKAAFHQIQGNRFAVPNEVFEGELDELPDASTELFEIGVQFSF